MSEQTSPLRAIGYCRTSGAAQRDNTSIPNQMAAIEHYCCQQKWTFTKHYVDESRTGSTIEGRDNYQQMLRDAANREFDVIVVFDIKRFGRAGNDIIQNSTFLRSAFGVNVVDAKNQFDTRDRRRTLINYVHAGVSEQERVDILERTTAGRISKAQAGLPWAGNPPIGRRWNKEKQKWEISEIGHRIAECLKRYVKGESMTDLVRELKFSGNAKLSRWIWHGQLSGTYVVNFRSSDLDIDINIPVPAIPEVIPQKLLEKVKARLKHNQINNRTDARQYLLTGILRCADCGYCLSAQTSKDVVYYRHRQRTGCTFVGIQAKDIEPGLMNFLYRKFLDERAFNAAVNKSMPSKDHRLDLEKQRDKAAKELAKTEKSIGRLVDAIANGADVSLLLNKQLDLKIERDALAERLATLDRELSSLPDPKMAKMTASIARIVLMEKLKERDWRKIPYEDVREFLISLFGETKMMGETGVFVRKNKHGKLVATLKGTINFGHTLIDGHAYSDAYMKEVKLANAEMRRILRSSGATDEEIREMLREVGMPAQGVSRKARGELEPSAEYLYPTMS